MKEQRYSDHEIIYMQVRLYHLACEKWDATPKEILAIFKKNNLFLKIKECYDSFHLYGECEIIWATREKPDFMRVYAA